MKIIITERQYSLIVEQVDGLDNFMSIISDEYNLSKNNAEIIRQSIINSGCKKIEFSKFKFPALGIALVNGVLINSDSLKKPLSTLLFIIFHEIAHSYQYRKYGAEKMTEFYTDKLSIKDAAKLMKEIEHVADEFASRKCREFKKLGIIRNISFTGFYKTINLDYFEKFIDGVKNELKQNKLTDIDDITLYFYNKVKAEIE